MEKEKILKFLKDIRPREYQWQIYEGCSEKNCLVILPTGLGKTLVALLLAIDRMIKFPSSKVVFLAPTRPLVEQHFEYFQKHLPELFGTMELFTGKTDAKKREELWQRADIVFSTPQCIGNDIKKRLYDMGEVSLLIEDECHRCIKNYAYTYVVKEYREQAKNPLVLGLTASPGHEKEKINKIAEHLGIEAIEIRTRESEDVKEYLQELEFENIKLDFPEELKAIRENLRIIYDQKLGELKNRKLLFGVGNKVTLLECQRKIMRAIGTGNKHFNLLVGASLCSQALKAGHAMELIETQTLASTLDYMTGLFDQAKKNESKAAVNLVKQIEFNRAYTLLLELIARKREHPKLLKLKEIVEEEVIAGKKAIVFCQYRDTIVKIAKELNSLKEINARVFVGQAKKNSGKDKEETGLSQREQKEMIQEFALGKINVLVSSSIGEEGLDIPEVNLVVFYEPIPSAIRQIQRRGRTARLVKGKLIILITKGTRDEAYYWSAFNKEKKMHKVIKEMKEDMDKGVLWKREPESSLENNSPSQKELGDFEEEE